MEAFFNILRLYNIKMSEQTKSKLVKQFKQGSKGIKYVEALSLLSVDLNSENPLTDFWIVRDLEVSKNPV